MMNSIFSFRFEISRKASSHDVLLVFAATPGLDPEGLATVIESEVEQNLVPDEVVFLVRDPAFDATQQALGEDFAECRHDRAAGGTRYRDLDRL